MHAERRAAGVGERRYDQNRVLIGPQQLESPITLGEEAVHSAYSKAMISGTGLATVPGLPIFARPIPRCLAIILARPVPPVSTFFSTLASGHPPATAPGTARGEACAWLTIWRSCICISGDRIRLCSASAPTGSLRNRRR